jgi:hypothetical protein
VVFPTAPVVGKLPAGPRDRGDRDRPRVGFLSFFFLALLWLLNIINKPFKVGMERTDDDVRLFLLHEFVVQTQASEAGETVVEDSRR